MEEASRTAPRCWRLDDDGACIFLAAWNAGKGKDGEESECACVSFAVPLSGAQVSVGRVHCLLLVLPLLFDPSCFKQQRGYFEGEVGMLGSS